ncbi:MAG: PEP-CTERM sorting domain-containing protein, partial [Deltaproteobacteria bacterium]|nr:PEP-CTERM sorting domain-containing protein [Deltaproteobacteria bacterium]
GEFSITATPEPSTILLMGLGLLGLVGLGRRRRK